MPQNLYFFRVRTKIGGYLMRKSYEKADFDIISLESCDIIRTSLGGGDNRRGDNIFESDGD